MSTEADRIRNEQIRAARTITLPAERRGEYRGTGVGIPPTSRPAGASAPVSRHVPKGHDAILRVLQDSKVQVAIVNCGGEEFTGTIYGRDKFTITLQTADGVRRVFYKHDISQFYSKADLVPTEQVA